MGYQLRTYTRASYRQQFGMVLQGNLAPRLGRFKENIAFLVQTQVEKKS